MIQETLPRSRFHMREPFSGLSHLAGAAMSLAGLVLLLALSGGDPWRTTSFGIYGASLVILYSASATYHLWSADEETLERLRKFDHVGIFLLIAGSYTPVCLVPLRDVWGWSLLGVVWGIAVLGILAVLFWRGMPIWFDLVLYIVMGWVAILGIGHIAHAIGSAGVWWLISGGVFYTVGAVVYASKRPRLWPNTFGSHDLWHIFVLAGSACHFMMMLCFVHPPSS